MSERQHRCSGVHRVARFYVGLDLGQSSDYTAVVVAEKVEPSDASGRDYELHIRYLERFRDVLYPDVAERVRSLSTLPSCATRLPWPWTLRAWGRPSWTC
jgi:hypothetical protein